MTWKSGAYLAIPVLLIVSGLYAFGLIGGADQTRVTAMFSSANGLYVGDDVRILGVRAGQVEEVHPEGTAVRVVLSVSSEHKLPADARAVILAPSLVASRFVQLTPAYSAGPVLPSGSTIPEARTSVPQTFDETKTQLTRLAKQLGPSATNPEGSLAQLIKVADTNLDDGNAKRLHDTIKGLSDAAAALSSGRGDLFETVQNLATFLRALVSNDDAVREFSEQLDEVSATLEDDRRALAVALESLGRAFGDMETFLAANADQTSGTVRDVAELSSTLAEQTKAIEQVVHVAPTALANFYNIIDPRYGAFTGALGLGNLQASGASLSCGLIAGILGVTPQTSGPELEVFREQCKAAVEPFAQLLRPIQDNLGGVPSSPVAQQSVPADDSPASPPAVLPGLPDLSGIIAPTPNTTKGLLDLLGLGGSK